MCLCTYTVLAFAPSGRPDMGTALQRANVLTDEDGAKVVLTKEKGSNHKVPKRRLSIPWWGLEQVIQALGALDTILG
ncbi:hypothetical protein CYMTET_21619 [Cymbomonas tetramitiformis]|uniref:Uncharacterized protein n=1 Tax=Cymbomonas tetramitiformis TaxID=36881 RepID=A0AAE0L304_9CHLO|nr:hypothetical protein CYMTET_21619 [Cymbomonas tetramitiformis]